MADRTPRAAVRLALALLGGATGTALYWCWGVPPVECLRLAGATFLLCFVPGWMLTTPLGPLLRPDERAVAALTVGAVATALLHYAWNVHVAPHTGMPSTTSALIAWCALTAAAGLVGWIVESRARTPGADPPPAADGSAWLCLATFLLPVAALAPFANPNGQIAGGTISFDIDEFTHFHLVGSMLRAGPPTINTLAGYPMPPYQFLVPSLSAAFSRLVAIDPIRLHCRWLPILSIGLASSTAFVLARRTLPSARAAAIAALALCYAGDAFTTWGFVTEIHSAFAYATLALAATLLVLGLRTEDRASAPPRVAERRAATAALVLAGFLLASLFHTKAPLYFTAGGALGLLAIERTLRHRDHRAWIAVGAALLFGLPLAAANLGSVRHSPLGIGAGTNLASLLGSLPAPWNQLGASRAFAFAIGLVLTAAAIANTRLVGLPWAVRAGRAATRPAPIVVFLGSAVILGLLAANVVYERGNPGGVAPLWFVQHPLLIGSQLLAGAAIDGWIARAGDPRRSRRRLAGVAIGFALLTAAVTLSLDPGDDPQKFDLAERDCGDWLRLHTEPSERVIHQPKRLGLPMFSLRASVLSLEPILKGSKLNGLAPDEYMTGLRAEVAERRADLSTFFSTSEPAVAREIAARYHARFVFVGGGERLGFPAEDAFGPPVTSCGNGAQLYRIE